MLYAGIPGFREASIVGLVPLERLLETTPTVIRRPIIPIANKTFSLPIERVGFGGLADRSPSLLLVTVCVISRVLEEIAFKPIRVL